MTRPRTKTVSLRCWNRNAGCTSIACARARQTTGDNSAASSVSRNCRCSTMARARRRRCSPGRRGWGRERCSPACGAINCCSSPDTSRISRCSCAGVRWPVTCASTRAGFRTPTLPISGSAFVESCWATSLHARFESGSGHCTWHSHVHTCDGQSVKHSRSARDDGARRRVSHAMRPCTRGASIKPCGPGHTSCKSKGMKKWRTGYGMEHVTPFLDRDVIAYLMSIPGEILNQGGVPRALLRQAMTGIVPSPILGRQMAG